MSAKLLVIISTGESQKAWTGLIYAHNARKEGWMEDVKVVFFGPAEHLLVEDEEIAKMAKALAKTEKPFACKFLSDRDKISEKIEALGVEVAYAGTVISGFIKDGYVPMVF